MPAGGHSPYPSTNLANIGKIQGLVHTRTEFSALYLNNRNSAENWDKKKQRRGQKNGDKALAEKSPIFTKFLSALMYT
jgi:hypothetical protein